MAPFLPHLYLHQHLHYLYPVRPQFGVSAVPGEDVGVQPHPGPRSGYPSTLWPGLPVYLLRFRPSCCYQLWPPIGRVPHCIRRTGHVLQYDYEHESHYTRLHSREGRERLCPSCPGTVLLCDLQSLRLLHSYQLVPCHRFGGLLSGSHSRCRICKPLHRATLATQAPLVQLMQLHFITVWTSTAKVRHHNNRKRGPSTALSRGPRRTTTTRRGRERGQLCCPWRT
mmetsp:Transcript_38672/g.62619  ORF Transcript_38672/g.62619 Transcript_38672/m.62619 type:complete len:225 (+) Transcript_38672:171-845(+)